MSLSIQILRPLIEATERRGVSRFQLLKAAGLAPATLIEGGSRLSNTEYNRLLLSALELSRDDALGLHIGEQSRSSAFGLLGHLSVHAGTLRQGLETVIRYKGILSDFPMPKISERGKTFLIQYSFPGFDSTGVKLSAELAMSALLRFFRIFVGPNARPNRVFFAYEPPPYRQEYERVFEGTARFEHEFTGIEFESTWLDCSQLFENPELYSVLQRQAEKMLGRITRESKLADIVLKKLALADPSKIPLMQEIARHFGMSARSLQRRLVAEGVGYKEVVEQARGEIAKRILESPYMSIKETAYAMGFTSPAAFHRAFKRWTGMTPKQYKSSY
ncbi:MAG: AraC family transcriptional regulator [Deltaproteobacteria bacterium]|nr:AraC family transcriptional regulator [Deltaproteobacteria bacterium]